MKSNKLLCAAIAVLALAMHSTAASQLQSHAPAEQQEAKPKPARPAPDLSKGPQMREEKRKLGLAREKHGLRAAAKLLGGGYVEEVAFDDELIAKDLGVLAALSDVVIRGLVKSNQSQLVRLREPGFREPIETIVTDYTISIFDVYKGDPALHSKDITVTIPGGRVEFDSGLWAEIHIGGMTPLLNQDEVILFLRPPDTEQNGYAVTFGRQGLFYVVPDGRVIPAATAVSPISRNTKRDYAEFLQQLHEAVAQKNPDWQNEE